METLTNNELQAIAIAMKDIKYPDTQRKFILEAYYGIFFKNLAQQLGVDGETVKQKLEHMQVTYPQKFEFIVDKMKIFWDTNFDGDELLTRLYQLDLVNKI